MTHEVPPLRLVLASACIAASALLAGCSSPSSTTTTQSTAATQPAPMVDTTTQTNYRK